MESPHLKYILDAVTPTVDSMVDSQVRYMTEENIPFTTRDIEDYRFNAVFDLVSVVGNYTISTDTIIVEKSYGNRGKVDIQLRIERNGQPYFLITRTIPVRGNIKVWHLRYTVESNLKKRGYNAAAIELITKRSAMKRDARISKDIEQAEKNMASQVEEIERKITMTDEEIIAATNLGKFSWDGLNQISKDSWLNEEEFNASIKRRKKEAVSIHREQNNPKRLEAVKKEYAKRIEKLKSKLSVNNLQTSDKL